MDINPVQVILFLLGFGSILFLAYVTSRYLAGKSIRAMRGKHMNIVESISLGLDKRLYLVKVGDKHILLAVSSKRIECLATLDLEQKEENEEPQANRNIFDFKTLFEKYIKEKSPPGSDFSNINKEKQKNEKSSQRTDFSNEKSNQRSDFSSEKSSFRSDFSGNLQKDKNNLSTDAAQEPEFRSNLGRLRSIVRNAGVEKGEVEITNDE